MKKLLVLMALGLGVGLNVTWMMEGCTGKLPPISAIVATSTPTLGPNLISNFGSQAALLNPSLINSNNGTWSYLPTTANIFASPGANGDAFCGRIYVASAVMAAYAPYELQANPNSTGAVYNLTGTAYGSPTNGIEFYWKVGSDDTTPEGYFVVPVPAQIPPPSGTCSGTGSDCYATFRQNLPKPANWTLIQYTWSEFTQASWGVPQTGPLTSNSNVNGLPNLSQIMYFQWEEDGGPSGGTFTTDFWLDDVQLF